MANENSKKLCCAAIGFGTSTGLAFSSDERKVIAITWEKDGLKGVYLKAPTAILFDSNLNFLAFGFEAVKRFTRMRNDQKRDCYYFENFIMNLHQLEKTTEKMMIKSTNDPHNKAMKAMKVIACAMKYLKDRFMNHSPLAKLNVSNSDIRWVVTLPAIWNASARQLMRIAAKKAGLYDENDPHSLIISLEPECAALYVHQYLNPNVSSIQDAKQGCQSIYKYIILDCGKRTVDVYVHQVLYEGNNVMITESYQATGGAWGEIYVNEQFTRFLKQIFSCEFISKVQSTLLTLWEDIERDFDFWKQQINPVTEAIHKNADDDDDLENSIIPIGLPFQFIMECQKFHEKDIDDIIKHSKIKGITFEMGKLNIKERIIQTFLMSQISQIVEHIKYLQEKKECSGCNAILLLGEFTECRLLQTAVSEAFSKTCNIIIPTSPSLAILTSSIKYGFNPTIISHHFAKFTYGLKKTRKFEVNDKEEYKYINSKGECYCRKVFVEIIREMTPITKENCIYKTFYVPIDREQKGIGITLFKSSNANAKYTTDDGVEKLGRLYVPMPGRGLDRKVEVTIDFSGTEIIASVLNLNTNETKCLYVDF